MSDSFVDPKRVTKSYIPAANAPIRIDVQEGHNQVSTESSQRLKRGRPIGSKDKNPRKTKNGAENKTEVVKTLDATAAVPKSQDLAAADQARNVAAPDSLGLDITEPDAINVAGPDVPNNVAWDAKLHGTDGPDNNEISINYVLSGKRWNRKHVNMDDIFAYEVALELMDNEDYEPTSIYECMQRPHWLKWKEAINVELESLRKRGVFGQIIRTPHDIKPVGYKWVFVRKRNENGEVVRYKARLVA